MTTSDISLAVGDGYRRMTYAELAEARGISVLAARRLTLRHRWHKQMGNSGLVTVSVPLSALENPGKTARSHDTTSRHGDKAGDATTDAASDTGRIFDAAITGLRDQLAIANQRADQAEQRTVEAQAAERKAIELVKYVTAEVADLRKRSDDALTAERIARDEAAGLRAELDARKQWGLWRRVRGR